VPEGLRNGPDTKYVLNFDKKSRIFSKS